MRVLYLSTDLAAAAIMDVPDLAEIEERDALKLEPSRLVSRSPAQCPGDCDGVVFAMECGRLSAAHAAFATATLACGRAVFLHWPGEGVVERLDAERLEQYVRLEWLARCWAVLVPLQHAVRSLRFLRRLPGLAAAVWRGGSVELARSLLVLAEADVSAYSATDTRTADDVAKAALTAAQSLIATARPQPLPVPVGTGGGCRIPGHGVYLRLDYWVRDVSGGGIGHTSYTIKALAAITGSFTAFVSRPYDLVEQFGIRQVVVPGPFPINDERTQLRANEHYHGALRAALAALKPAYVYERLCPGSFVGAQLCAELGIPYIAEYNGSEIAMGKAFGNAGHRFETAFLAAEAAAFAQASLISVVSEVVRDDLIQRGVPPAKVLTNPNGADPDDYCPPGDDERAAVRAGLGIADGAVVIGFTGTFGGWHGIEVLAEVIPQVCREAPEAVFLLIGDGGKKPLVDEGVRRHGIEDRVIRPGRVAQHEGARLLRGCDVFVSTHSGGIGRMRFFGSPTKIFEYMAMGQGIVATDLEQIGDVLSPALRGEELSGAVGLARAVLCPPGQARPVADALVALVRDRRLRDTLGRNARQALIDHYSWRRHVERLWLPAVPADSSDADRVAIIAESDVYKREAQNLWNAEACGSQYIEGKIPDTLEWFLEHERLRHREFYPWMPSDMEFESHAGQDVLEIGAGIGTDLARFARAGARTTDLDLSAGHLTLARRNFELRGLSGNFLHYDAEELPFADASFDLVYSFGVIHHSPRTRQIMDEIRRVLRPGGKAIIAVYAEESTNFWWRMVWGHGLRNGNLRHSSLGGILSRNVEMSERDVRPLVKVYSRPRLARLFGAFDHVSISTRHCPAHDRPLILRPLPESLAEKHFGWFHIVKAFKPG